jgi:hypothetical protein
MGDVQEDYRQTKVAMKRLHVVLKSVMLRRTKDATISKSVHTPNEGELNI